MDKTTILLQTTQSFKDALTDYALEHKISVAAVIRESVAAIIKYDLSKDIIPDGRKKYENTEARKEAQKARAKSERQLAKQIVAAIQHEQHLADIIGIELSLQKKGAL